MRLTGRILMSLISLHLYFTMHNPNSHFENFPEASLEAIFPDGHHFRYTEMLFWFKGPTCFSIKLYHFDFAEVEFRTKRDLRNVLGRNFPRWPPWFLHWNTLFTIKLDALHGPIWMILIANHIFLTTQKPNLQLFKTSQKSYMSNVIL